MRAAMRSIKSMRILLGYIASLWIVGCGSVNIVSTPIENIDSLPLKVAELTETQKRAWGHADLLTDTIPGMSVDKAYSDIIGNKKGAKVIVAVLDSGIDLMHEDLDDVMWVNSGEKPGNGKDDDGNGYVDDVHGYNFLGESYYEQHEFARILRLGLEDEPTRARAKEKLDKEFKKASESKQMVVSNRDQTQQIQAIVKEADLEVKKHLGKETYTKEEVLAIKTSDLSLSRSVSIIQQMYSYGKTIPEVLELIQSDIDQFQEGVLYFSERLDYHLNVNFEGRKVVGDNPYDISDADYGDGNPMNRDSEESHGTHVAGIIAAERNNGIGMNGVANNVAIMSVRVIPNGDEYDKDVALGIRYAVDNGAKVINASFGKSFSPNAEWVYEAIKYAADKDVLIVHAAGNDGEDLDDPKNTNFPKDHINGKEYTGNLITVGALNDTYGPEMIASFSNYGANNVDVFAPGGNIYSSMPNNAYKFQGGTSMAAPGVSGVAALIRSYFPKLSASEVKQIIIDSGLSSKTKVMLSGDPSKLKSFDAISVSGKMVNAYNALIMAKNRSNNKS
jgi:subtilisin family serine protease